jgi:hypothetical protein
MVLLLLCLGDGLFHGTLCLQNPCALSFSGLIMHYSGHKSASFFLEVLLRVRDKLLPHFLTFSVNGMAPLNRAGTISAWSAPSLGYLFTPSNFNFHSFNFSVPAAEAKRRHILYSINRWRHLHLQLSSYMRLEYSKLMESQPFIQYHNYRSFFFTTHLILHPGNCIQVAPVLALQHLQALTLNQRYSALVYWDKRVIGHPRVEAPHLERGRTAVREGAQLGTHSVTFGEEWGGKGAGWAPAGEVVLLLEPGAPLGAAVRRGDVGREGGNMTGTTLMTGG